MKKIEVIAILIAWIAILNILIVDIESGLWSITFYPVLLGMLFSSYVLIKKIINEN